MTRARPPRDRETAPGELPGAESFPASVREAGPQGIVRLSDLFSVADFEQAESTPSAVRPTGSGKRPARPADRLAGSERQRKGAAEAAKYATLRPSSHRECPTTAPPKAGTDPASATDPPFDSAPDPDIGPAYESLFPTATPTARPKRERKPATALQRALGLLTRREHSRKELVRKLVSRGVDAGEVEAAVDKLGSAGWQHDGRFAESLIRSRASTGYGPLHVRAELGTHGLPADLIQAALDDFDGDWLEIARDVVSRRFARVEDPRLRERKACDFLMRRGFPGELARNAARLRTDD